MISEVGYLHENPNIEAMLLRKGIQPLSEVEMIQVIDTSLSNTGSSTSPVTPELPFWQILLTMAAVRCFLRQVTVFT